jgi:hypothetical protein
MAYRVWQWGIEINLGAHLQTKVSSSFVKTGFDSKREALQWAATQDKSTWGNWDTAQIGESVVLDIPFEQLPQSYKAALAMLKTSIRETELALAARLRECAAAFEQEDIDAHFFSEESRKDQAFRILRFLNEELLEIAKKMI